MQRLFLFSTVCILLFAGALAAQPSRGNANEDPANFKPRRVQLYHTPCADSAKVAIHGLDNDSAYIVTYRFDNYYKSAAFVMGSGSLHFADVWGADSIIGHGMYFMEVHFRLGQEINSYQGRKILLCISGGQLHTALDILADDIRYSDGYFPSPIDSTPSFREVVDYNVSMNIPFNTSEHVLELSETRKARSAKDSADNMIFHQSYELAFDTSNFVFYDTLVHLKGDYTVTPASKSDTTSVTLSLDETVPAIKLWYPAWYYFIKGAWYATELNSTMLKPRQ